VVGLDRVVKEAERRSRGARKRFSNGAEESLFAQGRQAVGAQSDVDGVGGFVERPSSVRDERPAALPGRAAGSWSSTAPRVAHREG
jgi:hypothetical protein